MSNKYRSWRRKRERRKLLFFLEDGGFLEFSYVCEFLFFCSKVKFFFYKVGFFSFCLGLSSYG